MPFLCFLLFLLVCLSLSPGQRTERAKIAANARWGREIDRLAATKPGRDAAWQKLLHEADPEGILSESERLKRAKNLQQEQMARIRFLASKVRKCRAGLDVVPEAVPADAGGGA
jgi:hypothetical protein